MLNNDSLKDYIIKAVEALSFRDWTPVQKEVFAAIKKRKNLVVKSKTGSGKTHAFLIPIFQNLKEDAFVIQATIVAPTKELAYQIYKMAQHIASFSKDRIDIRLYSGGSDRLKEIERLNGSTPQIVIGTPGKIKDLAINENVLKIYTSTFFVVDEMDMMLEGGYEEQIDALAYLLKDSKMMFFSATMEENVLHFVRKYLSAPEIIDLGNTNDTKIRHIWIPLKHRDRFTCLTELFSTIQPYLAIVFANKKETVIDLANRLTENGYFVGVMHGDLSSRERKRVLKNCIDLKYQYLVATDLAARGLDISGVSHIINYELPYDYEFYLHRSGRTGRMDQDGIVYSFYEDVDDAYLDNLAKKKIVLSYYELKNSELVPYKGRATRQNRIKPQTDYQKMASKFVPMPKKVSPGYKKKRQAQINEIAAKLKKNEKKKKRRKNNG